MNKIYYLVLSLLLISGCSLDTKTGLWTDSKKLKSENEIVEQELFEKEEIFEKEFNTGLKIKLKKNYKKNSFINNLLNNNSIVDFEGKLEKVSKYKFSKIRQFDYF